MSEAVIVALIAAGATVIGAAIGYGKKSKEQAVLDAEREQQQKDFQNEMREQMTDIRKQLAEHNGYAEKFADTAVAIKGIQKDIEYLKKGIK